MSIGDYILKVGDGISHLVSGGLAIHSVYNISQGNYSLGIVEGLGAIYIQISKALNRKRRESLKSVEKLTVRAQQLDKKLNEQFENLFYKFDEVIIRLRKPVPVVFSTSKRNLDELIGPTPNNYTK